MVAQNLSFDAPRTWLTRFWPLVWLGSGLLIGSVGFSGYELLLPFSLLLPYMYGQTNTRLQAALLCAGYFLASSVGLPFGVSGFFDTSLFNGLLLWLASSLVFVAVYTVCWAPNSPRRSIGFVVGLILMSVPPFGIMGWASPLTTAGMIFPGMGFIGLGLTIVLSYALVRADFRFRALCVTCLASVAGLALGGKPAPPADWAGTSTQITYGHSRTNYEGQYAILTGNAREARRAEGAVVVLPEGGAGWITNTAKRTWMTEAELMNKTIVSGAERTTESNKSENLIVLINAESFDVIYRQRMPVPISMWTPWKETGTRATFFEQPIIEIENRRVAPLICYEQLIIWPILQSAMYDPDLIVGISNDWWARGTSIPRIQRASMISWARLFGTDLVMGFNT